MVNTLYVTAYVIEKKTERILKHANVGLPFKASDSTLDAKYILDSEYHLLSLLKLLKFITIKKFNTMMSSNTRVEFCLPKDYPHDMEKFIEEINQIDIEELMI